MNSIQIIIDNKISNIDIYIDVLKETIIVNNQEQKITEEQIDDLIRIIRTWKNEYSNPNIIDAESFFIKIDTKDGIEIIKGSGEYPKDYILLKEWISGFNE